MNRVWNGLITGSVYRFWLSFAFDPVKLTILSVSVYMLRNAIMVDFIRHIHFRMSFGRLLNQIILCLHYHQLHHGTNLKHFDKNLGLIFSA